MVVFLGFHHMPPASTSKVPTVSSNYMAEHAIVLCTSRITKL
jgi:hypothetical protein